jgi:hypothetical protein
MEHVFLIFQLTLRSIVLGDINGQLSPAFTKLATLHTKNNFAFAIITGNLFADDNDEVSDLLAGSIVVALPTYFTVGSTPLPRKVIEKIEKDEEVGYASIRSWPATNSYRYAQIYTSSESAALRRRPKGSRLSP